jgi:Peptidase M15
VTSQHFCTLELKCHSGINCVYCGGQNLCTPRLLAALEALRSVARNVPIVVTSAYRCAEHNAEIGGVADSEHVRGNAADIVIRGMTPAQMYRKARLVPAFRNGGIGVALDQGYIHVDVRTEPARWCYNATGEQTAWDAALVASAA